jgi:hypothetical protein
MGISLMLITPYLVGGVALVGISVWIMMMSESVLLAKVENEMRNSLEELSRKKEQEVEEVLYFLRQSQIAASPFESIDGAKKLCDRIGFPCMVVTSNHQIIKANNPMHVLLGWNKKELNGKPAHAINDIVIMSRIGSLCQRPEHVDKDFMITKYVYVHKTGKRIYGQMDASKIGSDGFLVMFHPEEDCLITYDEIACLID